MKFKWKIALINGFILFNICAVLLGSSRLITPNPYAREFFLPYLRWTRLLQGWLLFTPEPRRYSQKYRFDIKFEDGNTKSWVRPYPPNWNFFDRHLSYNFQKFDLASTYLEDWDFVRRDYARYVMKLHWSVDNPPLQISLIRPRAFWPKPEAQRPLEYDTASLKWEDQIIESYRIRGQNLE